MSTPRPAATDGEVQVAVARPTAFAAHVASNLTGLGIQSSLQPDDGQFVLIDLSGLGREAAGRLVQGVHRSGRRSMSIWTAGAETFYGPLAEPGRTACWYCCRQRFSDSIAGEAHQMRDEDPGAARIVAENVALATRYPEIAGFGWVLAEDAHGSALHSVLPMPWCDVCGGEIQPRASSQASVTRSTLVPEELRILADLRGGVVRRLLVFDSDGADAPAVPTCCSAVIGPYEGWVSRPEFNGEGKGATKEAAVRSAIGEGVERYAASLWDPSSLRYAPFDEIADEAFDPRWLVFYSDAQYRAPDFPFAPFDSGRPIHWTRGQWLDTGEPVWLPALATYLHFPAPASEQLAQATSNGLAAGASFEDAARRALYELIERDAFMLFWLSRRAALRVDERGCDAITRQALDEARRFGVATELYVLDAGTQHPTVVCLGLGDGRTWPGVTIGLGTHADLDVAVQRAVLEHGHCGPYIRRLMRDGQHRHLETGQDVLTALDHALYYVPPARSVALDWFRAGRDAPASLADLRSCYRQDASLRSCVTRLQEAGIRSAAVDVTSPDIALAPLRVVRAFGTHMQPIHFGFGNERLTNPRLERWLTTGPEVNPHPIA